MILSIDVSDSEINGFSNEAINSLKRACTDYTNGIVTEAKRIEQIDRVGSSSQVEVIASHVDEARKNFRRKAPTKIWKTIISILVDIFCLIVGILFDKEKLLNNNGYLIFYVIVIILTIIFLVIKYVKED